MANKILTAKVKFDTKSAEASLTRLSKKIQAVQKAVNKTSNGNKTLNSAIKKATTSTNKLNTATRKVVTTTNKVVTSTNKINSANLKAVKSAQQMNKSYRDANKSANGILSTVKKLAGAYLGLQAAQAIMNTSDQITSAKNRFNNLEGGSPEKTAEAMDKIYAAAQRSRAGYGDMLSNVSKTMTLAGDSFQGNIDNAIRFQEIMAKAYTVGGASDTEASTSMYQLVQALGSGVLQGDELRSVREGAPLAYKAIEKFAQGVYNTEESLKDLASQGKITSDMVVAAIMDADFSGKLEEQFNNTQVTFEQAIKNLKNIATKAFEPAFAKLAELLSSTKVQKMIEGVGNALVILANIVCWVIDIFASFFNWCADNWEWLKYVIAGVAAVILAILIPSFLKWLAVAIITAITNIASFVAQYWGLLLIVAGIMAILYIYELWRQGTISTTEAIVYCFYLIGLAAFIAGLIMMSLPMIIVGIVIIAIGAIIQYLDYFLGVVYSIGAFIYNIVVGIIDGILQLVFACIEPIIGVIEWILNACMGGFDGFGGAVANLIGQVISWFLSLGKVVTKIIDAIFGTNWTDGLSSLQDEVLKWGKNDNAITLSREAPTLEGLTGGVLPGRISYGDAWNTGMEHGAAAQDWMNNIGSQFQNQDGSYEGIFSDIGKLLIGDNALPNVNDPVNGVNGAWDEPTVDELLSGVDGIKDTMDIADDDLEWMRKIAEMEWRNEFTTAEIKVDMTNNNMVNSDRDLDGIVEYLSDVLKDEMTSVAYGVHY